MIFQVARINVSVGTLAWIIRPLIRKITARAPALALREWSVDFATVLMLMRDYHGVKFREKPF
jgi:hypothetical protein